MEWDGRDEREDSGIDSGLDRIKSDPSVQKEDGPRSSAIQNSSFSLERKDGFRAFLSLLFPAPKSQQGSFCYPSFFPSSFLKTSPLIFQLYTPHSE